MILYQISRKTYTPFNDEIYEKIYQLCIDNNVIFRVEYTGRPQKIHYGGYYTHRKRTIIVRDKEFAFMVKMMYSEEVEVEKVKY